jgi:hypothetical protein
MRIGFLFSWSSLIFNLFSGNARHRFIRSFHMGVPLKRRFLTLLHTLQS